MPQASGRKTLISIHAADTVFMNERRIANRKTRLSRVGISWMSGDGKLHKASAMIEDITPSGAGLRVNFSLPVGFPLLIETRNDVCAASIRHCVRDGHGYLMGIKLESPISDLAERKLV